MCCTFLLQQGCWLFLFYITNTVPTRKYEISTKLRTILRSIIKMVGLWYVGKSNKVSIKILTSWVKIIQHPDGTGVRYLSAES